MMLYVSRPQAQYARHRRAIDEAIARVLSEEQYILGPEVERFEHNFANWCEATHSVGVANGTDALTIALLALGIGAGDEVITVSHTAAATIAGIVRAGATPVMVDIEPETWTIDPAAAEAAIGPQTRAIIPVHLYGHPADMDAIASLARKHSLAVIEDCAQAHGARWRGKRVGALGDAGTFSFYPTKNLGAIGDGGAIIFKDAAAAKKARQIREYGWDDRRISQLPGFNSRLDELQAAILSAKLPHLDEDNAARTRVADRYQRALAGLPIQRPVVRTGATHVWHLYVVAHPRRDELRRHLATTGIAAGIHYFPPTHRQPAWSGGRDWALPHTERAATDVLSLPMYPALADDDVDKVTAAFREFF